MAMEDVTAYKTSDGKLWEDHKAAAAHEKCLVRKETIESWVERHCYSQMHTSDIADALYDYGHELGV